MSKIKKIKVSTGIYWVEIPEARLYVICGCPPDSVKHLTKRGLIVTTEKKGVTCETGPNAILLSDAMVQEENIANMAEFPVLQMLYRQGMILPGHPNNDGTKPILIGNEEQVISQMAYIYRGNYGLVSEEEIMATGIPKNEAKEMMRLKLKFAFGKISSSEELLDTKILRDSPVKIKKGVTIQRLRPNVFKFRFKKESVEVDLNLQPGVSYETPYPLGFHNMTREYFSVIHAGEGDGWDMNRPCMGSILMFQGKIYLIDAGPNVFKTLLSLGIGVSEIEGIFHTHAHDDHFSGLTTLMRADHRIRYFATPLVRASVIKKLSALINIDEHRFSSYFQVEDLTFDVWNDIEGLEVKPILSPHPVETSIFVFRTLWEEGYKTYSHFADIVSLDVLEGMIVSGKKDPGISRSYFNRIKKTYLEPSDLKKLDIGGGMIHGLAEDFKNDDSGKIVLSHTGDPLSLEQKKTGSEANFGTMDVLIPSTQDYAHSCALEYLTACFPSASANGIRMLLNNPITTLNPGTVLMKGGDVADRIYLILTGYVEKISQNAGFSNILNAGALIGEVSALTGGPSNSTYHTASYVQVLGFSASLYTAVMKQSGLLETNKQLRGKRKFLQDTWLFGEGISSPIHTALAEQIKLHVYPVGYEFDNQNASDLYLVKQGQAQLFVGHNLLETVTEGGFFGEDSFFGMPYLFGVRTVEPLEVFQIPHDAIRHIPIVQWKLFQTMRGRRRILLMPGHSGGKMLIWKDAYSVMNQEMDEQHQLIFKRANQLYESIDLKQTAAKTKNALSDLIETTISHFNMEEALMEDSEFPGLATQKEQHQKFAARLSGIQKAILDGKQKLNMDFLDLYQDWFIYHILTDDRLYSNYVAENE
ncbi:MAG: bacteriohemerythrin [Deltaproteobacteria bacterium]|nr:bacteriohemerythrin [Deltaproteobacteria bacterium]MBT4643511.1 bacteriohemerythrin [Deltaproteobacteria bacterium]MBT6503375.1 bacteriohemerythrin [Deltaproteobacteria bacterium]MBT6615358.1 bacteriohemerythrin [Deltaproteobacteria bacterium]MBT7151310.1 bacteriohemerythrin [Deltaproteobacteria bacterium]